ncbi:unnamed protein product [Cyclocybe aegerita]|uniref:Uncharacterized protein n=1 Tax=Cyclocybe aegerita TaxID=1973307 RepID=A0A8S0VQX5_CYCAE|nr:unnamed protein product [Cyclocybe aegerita]
MANPAQFIMHTLRNWKSLQRVVIYPRIGSSRDENEPQMRTVYTPYADKSHRQRGGFQQPTFWRDPDALRTRMLPSEDTIIPAAHEELEWLEAFLKVCVHMSAIQEEWKKGQTIAEYLHLHS